MISGHFQMIFCQLFHLIRFFLKHESSIFSSFGQKIVKKWHFSAQKIVKIWRFLIPKVVKLFKNIFLKPKISKNRQFLAPRIVKLPQRKKRAKKADWEIRTKSATKCKMCKKYKRHKNVQKSSKKGKNCKKVREKNDLKQW